MKVIRVTKTEFEIETGVVFPIDPPLTEAISVEEFQKIYDKNADFIKSISNVGSDNADAS